MGTFPLQRSRSTSVEAVLFIILLIISALSVPTGSMKVKETLMLDQAPSGLLPKLYSLGDFDQDGDEDIAISLPRNASGGFNKGSVHIFWGTENGFESLEPGDADIIIVGRNHWLLGHEVEAWDFNKNGWKDLVISCPGANNGSGTVLIFESAFINGVGSGSVLSPGDAEMEIPGNGTYFYGTKLQIGEVSGDGAEDLIVMSASNETLDCRADIYFGGILPDFAYKMTLPSGTVDNETSTTTVDLYGEGFDALVLSTPDSGEVRVIQLSVDRENYFLPGANSTGVVDFAGSIYETGDTWGRAAGDDGWDISPYHVYDDDSFYNYVRWNQQTGNPRGGDRSVENLEKLFIEVGGDRVTSNNRDQSGAYGVEFYLSYSNITGIDSAVLTFDYEWENWGFESNERYWVKARLTDTSDQVHWLGFNQDRQTSPDDTNDIFTRTGVNGPPPDELGLHLHGNGTFSMDILPLIDGTGTYYLDLGGKVSRWTVAEEFLGVGFDNISLTFRTLNHDIKKITGAGGLGSSLHSLDVDQDGYRDLLVSSPQDGMVRIFKGNESHWVGLAGINQGMANITIDGTSGTALGEAAIIADPSPFTPNISLMISDPDIDMGNGSGEIYFFGLPLSPGVISTDSAFVSRAPNGLDEFGWKIFPVGDIEGDDYQDIVVASWNWFRRLTISIVDRSPSPPELRLLKPGRGEIVKGMYEIRARVRDEDQDAGPEDARFYLSLDPNTSPWVPISGGEPTRVEGDVAVKVWNTSEYENRVNPYGYFLKVEVTDDFGLTKTNISSRVEVLNHEPPNVLLTYPTDGMVLSGSDEIKGKALLPPTEDLSLPVDFFYSLDGSNWTFLDNTSTPDTGSQVDFSVDIDTTQFEDGPIWFRFNATTVYGLGSEDQNEDPCIIDNAYPPSVGFLTPSPNSTLSGIVNVTVNTSDPDNDLTPPARLFLREAGLSNWVQLSNMSGPDENGTYWYNWDTTGVDNGDYFLLVSVVDSTFKEAEAELNMSVHVRNVYSPSISFSDLETGDTIADVYRFSAPIVDRDFNIDASGIRFFYRSEGTEQWNQLSGSVLVSGTAELSWDTKSVLNGVYDFRVEVTDGDNRTASAEVEGVIIKNLYKPRLWPDLPEEGTFVSGTVVLRFNVSDEEAISPDDITVEVLSREEWITLDGLEREEAGGDFVPWKNITYSIEWDTTAKNSEGEPLFPDGPGYDVRINILDSDGLTASYKTTLAYQVNNEGGGQGEDDGDEDEGMESWLIIVIALGVIVLLLILIFIVFLIRGERKVSKDVPLAPPPTKTKQEAPEAKEKEEPEPAPETKTGELYSPTGWSAPPPAEPMEGGEDIPAFTADADLGALGLDLDLGEGEEDLTSMRDQLFAGGAKPERKAKRKPSARKRPAEKAPVWEEETIQVDLPEDVLPSRLKKELEPEEEEGEEPEDEIEEEGVEEEIEEEEIEEEEGWEDVEEWGDDEEMEELEEEDWEELEEDEDWEELDEDEDWEEEEEEEDIPLIVSCKCGEEIEIPSEFKGNKFRCPNCGRRGKIPR